MQDYSYVWRMYDVIVMHNISYVTYDISYVLRFYDAGYILI